MVQFFMVLVHGALLDEGLDAETAAKLAARFDGGAAVPVMVETHDGPTLDRISATIEDRNRAEKFGWVAIPVSNPVLSDEMGSAIGFLFGW